MGSLRLHLAICLNDYFLKPQWKYCQNLFVLYLFWLCWEGKIETSNTYYIPGSDDVSQCFSASHSRMPPFQQKPGTQCVGRRGKNSSNLHKCHSWSKTTKKYHVVPRVTEDSHSIWLYNLKNVDFLFLSLKLTLKWKYDYNVWGLQICLERFSYNLCKSCNEEVTSQSEILPVWLFYILMCRLVSQPTVKMF